MENGVQIMTGCMTSQSHNICASCPFVRFCFYAINFEEVEGAHWFGPVRVYVRPLRFAFGHKRFEIGS